MARAIPALPVVPAEPRRFAPRLPILSGQGTTADDVGHWYDLAREINLDIATGNASVVFENTWTDGQFNVASVGFLNRTRTAIPPLSGYHTLVRCSVYGWTPTAGTVRFQGTNAASLVDIILPGVVGWTDSAGPAHLAVAFAGAPSYEEITIDTDGDCNIEVIKIEYLDYNPGGLWPGADDAIALGPVPGSANASNPMDDAEVGPDKPLASDLGVNILRNLRDLEARERVYFAVAGFDPLLVPGSDQVIATFPHRVAAPVLDERDPTVELIVAVYATAAGGNFKLYVQRSGADYGIHKAPPRNVVTLTITAPFAQWQFFRVELTGGPDFNVPNWYRGLTTLAIRPELATLTQHAETVVMWSR